MTAWVDTCRSCSAPIWWRTNTKTQKLAPIDVAPDSAGRVVIVGEAHYRILGKDEIPPAGAALHTSHFATCREAAKHRRPTEKKAPEPQYNPTTKVELSLTVGQWKEIAEQIPKRPADHEAGYLRGSIFRAIWAQTETEKIVPLLLPPYQAQLARSLVA